MFRAALIAFVAAIVGLVVVAQLPEDRPEVPEQSIFLADASVALYPAADPGAVWTFDAPQVVYDPSRRETTLVDLRSGERWQDGEIDLQISANEITIDSQEDLRAQRMFALLTGSGECLTMLGGDREPVVVDQRQGRFLIPVLELEGEGFGGENRWERVRTSFDLEEFEAGGAGTTTVNEFRTGASDDPRRTSCDERFPSS